MTQQEIELWVSRLGVERPKQVMVATNQPKQVIKRKFSILLW